MGPSGAFLLPRAPHRPRPGLCLHAPGERLHRTHLQPRRRSSGGRALTLSRRDRAQSADGGHPQTQSTIMTQVLAEITGSIQGGLGCLGAAIGVGRVGFKAAEAVGRNPGASTKILVQGIIGMALAEAVAFYALFIK